MKHNNGKYYKHKNYQPTVHENHEYQSRDPYYENTVEQPLNQHQNMNKGKGDDSYKQLSKSSSSPNIVSTNDWNSNQGVFNNITNYHDRHNVWMTHRVQETENSYKTEFPTLSAVPTRKAKGLQNGQRVSIPEVIKEEESPKATGTADPSS